jgi:pyruvate dehydrogenase E1 component alpha subunit
MKLKEVPELPILNNSCKLESAFIIELLERMLTIRFTEERIAQRVTEKRIMTPCHLYIGQEASAVGVCAALKDTDYVFSTHRSHGHFLAKGGDINRLFAEIYCKSTGCSGGRGGSMHLCDPSIGLLGSSSIVAGCLGIGLGPAFKSHILGLNDVSVVFHGDCVPEEGIWHESLNFAAVKKLPVIYICENNLYAASAPLEERRKNDNISEVATAHGLHTEVVDGNDIFAVYEAAREAVKRAREGEGPQFIENRTYRWLGHVGPKDDIDVGLRDYNELLHWKERCPIKNLEKKLMDDGLMDEESISRLYLKVRGKVDTAEEFAINSPNPDPDDVLKNVYHCEV